MRYLLWAYLITHHSQSFHTAACRLRLHQYRYCISADTKHFYGCRCSWKCTDTQNRYLLGRFFQQSAIMSMGFPSLTPPPLPPAVTRTFCGRKSSAAQGLLTGTAPLTHRRWVEQCRTQGGRLSTECWVSGWCNSAVTCFASVISGEGPVEMSIFRDGKMGVL